MKSFTYVITDRVGIHARPAGIVVKTAQKYESEILIYREGDRADAKKLTQVMSLGAKNGDQIRVDVTGKDEEEAAEGIRNVLKENL